MMKQVKRFFLILHNEKALFELLDLEAFEKVHFEPFGNETVKKIFLNIQSEKDLFEFLD